MKFQNTIDIDAPREFVATFFGNPENKRKWHPDLKSIEPIVGKPGESNSVLRLDFEKFILTETVLENRLPEQFFADYDAGKHCRNTMRSTFEDLGNQTRYTVETEYTYFSMMLRIISWTMPWTLKRPVDAYLQRFKTTVEAAYAKQS